MNEVVTVIDEPMPVVHVNPMTLLQTAIEKGMDPDKLGKLMDLVERFEMSNAEKEFNDSMSRFQGMVGAIVKRRTVNAGSLNFKFAAFGDIMSIVERPLAECGLAVSFDTEIMLNEGVQTLKTICTVSKGVFNRKTQTVIPLPEIKVSDTQKMGAALTYGMRYTIVLALRLHFADKDTDGNLDPSKMEEWVHRLTHVEDVETLNQIWADYNKLTAGQLKTMVAAEIKKFVKERGDVEYDKKLNGFKMKGAA